VRKQFFFEKKEPKNFCLFQYVPIEPIASTNEQKFFVSFFQKRNTSFLLLGRDSPKRYMPNNSNVPLARALRHDRPGCGARARDKQNRHQPRHEWAKVVARLSREYPAWAPQRHGQTLHAGSGTRIVGTSLAQP
jgi:hypothetical protein